MLADPVLAFGEVDAEGPVARDVGFLACGLSPVTDDIARGTVVLPFPASRHITAAHPYRAILREGSENRPQVRRFMEWLRQEAVETERQLRELTG